MPTVINAAIVLFAVSVKAQQSFALIDTTSIASSARSSPSTSEGIFFGDLQTSLPSGPSVTSIPSDLVSLTDAASFTSFLADVPISISTSSDLSITTEPYSIVNSLTKVAASTASGGSAAAASASSPNAATLTASKISVMNIGVLMAGGLASVISARLF